MMTSMPTSPLHDDIFVELDSIVPDGDLEILDIVLLDEDWDSIKNFLLNSVHSCQEICWSNDPPMSEQPISKFDAATIGNHPP